MLGILDTIDGGEPRIRAAVADNYELVLAALLLVGAVGGYLTYTTVVDPGTTTESREVASWQSSGEFTHQATVVDGTEALEEGTVLRNRSTYFQSVTPELDGAFAYSYAASDDGSLDADTTVSVAFRSVEPDTDGNETVYWAYDRRIASSSAQSLSPGAQATVPFTVNATALSQEAERVDEEFGGTPGDLQTVVVVRTELSGTRNGQPVDATRTYRLPIQPDGSLYRVADPGVVTESGGQTERVSVPVEYGPLRTAAGPLLLALSLVAAGGLVYARRDGRLAVTDRERQWLAYRSTREEFDDWITTGRVPDGADGSAVVEVDTLSGLVDLAIDTDNRVLEDRARGACLVLAEDRWYRYETPPEPLDGAGPEPVDTATGEADAADD